MMTAFARPHNLLKSLEQGSGVQNYNEHTKNIISFRISKLRISLKFLSFLHMSILLRLICERSISSFKMNKVLIWKHIKITKNVQFWDTIRISYPSNLFFIIYNSMQNYTNKITIRYKLAVCLQFISVTITIDHRYKKNNIEGKLTSENFVRHFGNSLTTWQHKSPPAKRRP